MMWKFGKLEQKLIDILKNYKGRYVVKSFNPFSVLWFKKNAPEIIRGQLSKNNFSEKSFFKKIFLENMCFNVITKPDFLSYEINSLPNKKVEKFRKNHIVLGWTARNKEQFEKARKYCDNIICENFEELIIKI